MTFTCLYQSQTCAHLKLNMTVVSTKTLRIVCIGELNYNKTSIRKEANTHTQQTQPLLGYFLAFDWLI